MNQVRDVVSGENKGGGREMQVWVNWGVNTRELEKKFHNMCFATRRRRQVKNTIQPHGNDNKIYIQRKGEKRIMCFASIFGVCCFIFIFTLFALRSPVTLSPFLWYWMENFVDTVSALRPRGSDDGGVEKGMKIIINSPWEIWRQGRRLLSVVTVVRRVGNFRNL